MARDDDWSGRNRPDDVLDFGRDRPVRPRWRSTALLVCLVLVVTLAVVLRVSGHHAVRHHEASGSYIASRPPPVRVVSIGHRLLGVTAGWELFARGPDDLLRIQLAQGRVTWTYVPPLATASPAIAFVMAAHETVIQPGDIAPGYVVPDGGQARLLTGPLSSGGPVVPGPAGSHSVWVIAGLAQRPHLSLITLTGHPTGPTIRFRPGGPQVPATAISDGRGGVLLTTTNYTDYDARPGSDRALPGTLIAVGPAGWLTVACGVNYGHCRYDVVNASTGASRLLPGTEPESPFYFTWPPIGVISPNGDTAALALPRHGGATTVHLINLRTGAVKDLGVAVGTKTITLGVPANDLDEESMVWSPDSHWLFVAANNKLVVVNARTDRVASIGTQLPPVDQVAIRP
jgi:hypothetical protein